MKTLKSLTLFTALVILSACSASGNDGKSNGGNNGGGSQTIFDKLIGTWEGDHIDPPFSFVFTKENVTVDADISVSVKEVTLKDGRTWALYHNDKEPSFPYTIYYTSDGKNLHWMTGSTEQEILDTDKDNLDLATAVVVAVKKP